MNVEVVQLLQEMNFATRQMTTFIVLALPDGKRVRVAVDAAVAEAIIQADVNINGQAPAAVMPTSTVEEPPEDEEDEVPPDYVAPPPSTVISESETEVVRVFGEEPTPAPPPPPKKKKGRHRNNKKTVAEMTEALTAPEPPPPEPRVPPKFPEPRGTRHYQKLVKEGQLEPNAYARTVPKDDYGYPIVQAKEGTADPQAVVGTQNQDEDGVGSV